MDTLCPILRHAGTFESKSAHADRRRLSLPQGLVFQRLMSGELPPVYLRKDPFKGLPGDYLEAIGYHVPSMPEEEDSEDCAEDIVDLQTVIEPENHEPAGIAWRAVQVQLQDTMPRNNFDTYVRETNGVSMGDGWLTVRAKCADDCEWLENRLESTVNRMLIGICGSNVRVQFVSAGGE